MKILPFLVAILLLAMASSAHAGVIFKVDFNRFGVSGDDGQVGQIQGTLTTNGNTGFFANDDIVDFDLLLSVGATSFQFTFQEGDVIDVEGFRTSAIGLALDPLIPDARFVLTRSLGADFIQVSYVRSASGLSVLTEIRLSDPSVSATIDSFTNGSPLYLALPQAQDVPSPAMLAILLAGLIVIRLRKDRVQLIAQARLTTIRNVG